MNKMFRKEICTRMLLLFIALLIGAVFSVGVNLLLGKKMELSNIENFWCIGFIIFVKTCRELSLELPDILFILPVSRMEIERYQKKIYHVTAVIGSVLLAVSTITMELISGELNMVENTMIVWIKIGYMLAAGVCFFRMIQYNCYFEKISVAKSIVSFLLMLFEIIMFSVVQTIGKSENGNSIIMAGIIVGIAIVFDYIIYKRNYQSMITYYSRYTV